MNVNKYVTRKRRVVSTAFSNSVDDDPGGSCNLLPLLATQKLNVNTASKMGQSIKTRVNELSSWPAFLAVRVCVSELEDAGVTDSVLISHAVPGLHVMLKEGGGRRGDRGCLGVAAVKHAKKKSL